MTLSLIGFWLVTSSNKDAKKCNGKLKVMNAYIRSYCYLFAFYVFVFFFVCFFFFFFFLQYTLPRAMIHKLFSFIFKLSCLRAYRCRSHVHLQNLNTLVHRYNAGNQVGIVHHYTRKILYYNLKLEIKNPVLQSEIRN